LFNYDVKLQNAPVKAMFQEVYLPVNVKYAPASILLSSSVFKLNVVPIYSKTVLTINSISIYAHTK